MQFPETLLYADFKSVASQSQTIWTKTKMKMRCWGQLTCPCSREEGHVAVRDAGSVKQKKGIFLNLTSVVYLFTYLFFKQDLAM